MNVKTRKVVGDEKQRYFNMIKTTSVMNFVCPTLTERDRREREHIHLLTSLLTKNPPNHMVLKMNHPIHNFCLEFIIISPFPQTLNNEYLISRLSCLQLSSVQLSDIVSGPSSPVMYLRSAPGQLRSLLPPLLLPLLPLPGLSCQLTQRRGFRQVEEHKVCVVTGASR